MTDKIGTTNFFTHSALFTPQEALSASSPNPKWTQSTRETSLQGREIFPFHDAQLRKINFSKQTHTVPPSDYLLFCVSFI